MGSDDRYTDASSLHDLFLANYVWTDADFDDLSVMNRLYGVDGETFPLGVKDGDFSMLRHRWGDPEPVVYRDIILNTHLTDGLESNPRGGSGHEVGRAEDSATVLERSQSVGSAVWHTGDDLISTQEITVR